MSDKKDNTENTPEVVFPKIDNEVIEDGDDVVVGDGELSTTVYETVMQAWVDSETSFEDIKEQFLERLSWAMAASLIDQYQTIDNHLKFVEGADKYLFSQDTLKQMIQEGNIEGMIYRRKDALSTIYGLLDFTRKFVKDHKEYLESDESSDRVMRFRKLLASMNPKTLDQAIAIIERLLEND